MKKKVLAITMAFIFMTQTAHASVLGSVVTSWSHEIANGTDFYKNVFLSDQSGVGKQTEYYAEYTPNDSVVPTVVNGESLWGLRTITQAEEFMRRNGMTPLIGINASFFSFKTGVPMGHVLAEGRIISKDTQSYPSIGFRSDGSAFIAPLSIETTLTCEKEVERNLDAGETAAGAANTAEAESIAEAAENTISLDIAHINKYNQTVTDVVNLYTRDFDKNNHTEGEALNLILGDISGELAIGKSFTATVEEKFVYKGAIAIPDGKIVLTLNTNGRQDLYESLNNLEIGDSVTVSSRALNDSDKWDTAVSGLGSEGDMLVKDGAVQSGFASGAAPRTAVGITSGGNIIFYVIDGRQTGYSYGVQLKSLANRMKELGCVDAINLDGGGSTAISGIYPGSDENAVLNSPSEGTLRSCANYIFLKNAKSPTGELGKLYLYPFEQHYLSGYSETIYPTAVDTAYYKIPNPEGIEFSVSGTDSSIDKYSGLLTAKGTGEFTVDVTGGGASGSAKYHTYATPTNIGVYNGKTNKEIKSLNVKKGDVIKLNLTAQYYYIDLKTSKECFNIEVTDNMGYVSDNNELVITSGGGTGSLLVRAGEYTKKIPITVEFQSVFNDISDHWARDMVNFVHENGIINGYETENGVEFKPDNNMTRAEFAVIMCKFLDIDTEEYKNAEMSFADRDKIAGWSEEYIAAMSAYGLMTGKADGEKINFAPDDSLTRAEAMTILGRSIGGDGSGDTVFDDSDKIPDWAAEYVDIMVTNGFVSGYEDNTIRPEGLVTRAEAVTMLYKIMNKSF
ncbi:MAG: S-layer homology domain-containing protein [Clostridiales bacterium]|nr:S-layer homology domain-containing protein [Clostridiales bacterium]